MRRWFVPLLAMSVAFAGGYWWHSAAAPHDPLATLGALFPTTELHATAAAQADSFAIATGPIDDDMEGLYTLDALTGDLQCVVLNHRTGRFGAFFRTNVIQDLVSDPAKRPKFLIVTGTTNFPRGGGAARPGNSVVYVLDTTSGNFAAYGIPWRREIAASGRGQVASLLRLDVGTARMAALRD